MLVLGSKTGEIIRIRNDIVIRICQIKGSTVRVGIEAPEDVVIMRGELPSWNESDEAVSRSPPQKTTAYSPLSSEAG